MKRHCYVTEGRSYLRISTSQKNPEAQFYKTTDSNTTKVWSISTYGVSSWSNMLHKHTQNLGSELAWSSQTAGCKQPLPCAFTATRPTLRPSCSQMAPCLWLGSLLLRRNPESKNFHLYFKVSSYMTNGRKCISPSEFKPRCYHWARQAN